jgi:predicted PurR-regulated permease PerM
MAPETLEKDPVAGRVTNNSWSPYPQFEQRMSSRLLDVFVRAGLISVLVVLCYRVFAPFLTLMVWALILAVTMYPLHQWLAHRIGGRQRLAATLVLIGAGLLIIAPTALLMNAFGSSVHSLIAAMRDNTLSIPAPWAGVSGWPIVGERIYDVWSRAHADLPGLVMSMQPQIGELARAAISIVANIGIEMLQFLASFIIAGILLPHGEAGARVSRAILERVCGSGRGETFTRLSAATIRAVAQGVIGIGFIQAVLVGLALLVADVPGAGILAAITLVLSIAQVPAILITLPVIGYIWLSGNYSTGAAILDTVMLLVAGMADNVLKPLILGRGVDAPMPIVLLGALGGMAAAGIVGMFVGATLLALGYQIFMTWVATDPDTRAAGATYDSETT